MNNLDNNYLELIEDIIEKGTVSGDRTGTGTKKVFGREIRHKMSEGLPILTSKRIFSKGVIYELLWFLSGDTNTKYLIDNGVEIWVGDCYKKYLKDYENSNKGGLFELSEEPLTRDEFIEYIKTHDLLDPFVKKYADIGPGYGKMWRSFGIGNNGKDQIKELIKELKTNPDSRRLMVNAWDPNTFHLTTLPPCHYGFQLFTRELSLDEILENNRSKYSLSDNDKEQLNELGIDWKVEVVKHLKEEFNVPLYEVSLKWNQRSVDSLLGLPFNILSYGLLLEMIAQQVNMIPGELIGSLGDTHVYLNQIEMFENEQKNNEGYELPTLKLNKAKDIFSYKYEDFEIVNYKSNKVIKYPLSN